MSAASLPAPCSQMQQVEAMTQRYEQTVPKAIALAPTAKLRLRRLWYKLLHINAVQPGEVYIYMCARCVPGWCEGQRLCT